ncbi:MAG: hypothetical protein CMC70_10280 [Flavobacteriaceae bacterium]|nr:hypothetical protein [Flavobacteriaceae bacterium]
MDPNQWSMLIDSIAVLLAISGVVLGYVLYKKQRRDNSEDAFSFFQSSLPELEQSIALAIVDLKEFTDSLDLDNFVNPILSASLNDSFLNKINLVDLNRYYVRERSEELPSFKQLLVDSNFFGDYHSYITQEINDFRTNYLHKKEELQKDTDKTVSLATEMVQMKTKIKGVLEKDIAKFEAVLENIRELI